LYEIPGEGDMLKITKATDYAMQAMIHMACLPPDGVALRTELAAARNIPASFMAKVLRRLVRAGLLRSTRGVHGGFALARPAPDISMLDVVEAIDGPVELVDCLPDGAGCAYSRSCPAMPVWNDARDALRTTLDATSLEDLVSKRVRRGRLVDTRPCVSHPAASAVAS
jgi:Rrf2 family protein